MALYGDRHVEVTDVSMVCNDVCSEGQALCYGIAGSGAGMGDTTSIGSGMLPDNAGSVTLAANPSGLKPAGITLANFVNVDQTRYHRNWYTGEQVVGEKAPLLRRGWVVTNAVTGTPAPGNKAYVTTNGQMTPTVSATGGTVATPMIGEFMTGIDENGYAKVSVNLPTAF